MKLRLAISIALIMWSITCLPVGGTTEERFVDNGDGTITDNQLKLMWARADNQGDMDWHEAVKWIRFTFPDTLPTSYSNWRLPTLKELQSLVVKDTSYETDCGLKAHIIPLIRLSCAWVWTSESDPVGPAARVFNFDNIYHYSVRKAHRRGYRALAVRDIP